MSLRCRFPMPHLLCAPQIYRELALIPNEESHELSYDLKVSHCYLLTHSELERVALEKRNSRVVVSIRK